MTTPRFAARADYVARQKRSLTLIVPILHVPCSMSHIKSGGFKTRLQQLYMSLIDVIYGDTFHGG